jgi:hypothetical protein
MIFAKRREHILGQMCLALLPPDKSGRSDD